MAVDWGILQPQPAVADTYLKGFTQGQALAKDAVVRNAFAKLGTDPAGAQADLLRVGAIPEASALSNLQLQQQTRSLLTAAYAKLGLGSNAPNAITGQTAQPTPAVDPTMDATAAPGNVAHPSVDGSGQPAPDGSAPQDIPHPSDLNPDQAAHALEMSHAFDALGMEVAGLPYADRKARIAAEKPQLLAKGVPENVIDGFDPTDQNIATLHNEMAQLRGMLPPTASVQPGQIGQAAPAPAAAPVVPGQPATAQPASGGGFNLMDPNTQQGLQALAIADPQAAGPLISLGSATMPKFAPGRPGAPIFDEKSGQITGFAPGADGSQIVKGADGQWHKTLLPGAEQTAGALVRATEGPKADIAAAHDIIEVPDGNGGKVSMSRADYLARLGGSSTSVGTPSLSTPPTDSSPALGHSLSPAQNEYQTGQAKAVSDTVAADSGNRSTAMTSRDNALRNLTIASQTPFNPATPHFAAGANAFRALPPSIQSAVASAIGTTPEKIDQFASNAAIYTQGSNQLMLSYARSNLPSRYAAQELNIVRPIIGQLSDPNAAAQNMDALQVAIHNREIARADYAEAPETQALLAKTPSKAAYEAGWAKSEAGRKSLFADPVFRSFQVGGKPAVVPFTIPSGPHKGQQWLAVYPGLGHPTYLPAN